MASNYTNSLYRDYEEILKRYESQVQLLQETNKLIKDLKKHKINIVVTSLDTNKSMYNIDYNKSAIVIGNEANGVSKEIQDLADNKVKIPMIGKTESLNASVATGMILYEYVRQKMKR